MTSTSGLFPSSLSLSPLGLSPPLCSCTSPFSVHERSFSPPLTDCYCSDLSYHEPRKRRAVHHRQYLRIPISAAHCMEEQGFMEEISSADPCFKFHMDLNKTPSENYIESTNHLKQHKPRKDINVNTLSSELWEEIFSRLPYKSLCAAKCVSKAWMTLISDANLPQPLTTPGVFYRDAKNQTWEYACLSEEELQSGGLSLKFLPCYVKKNFKIESTSNGLIICSNTSVHGRLRIMSYYLCNPLTKEWIELPQRRQKSWSSVPTVALAFDPSISVHFRVIRFLSLRIRHGKVYKTEIFSSETGQWVESTVQGEVPNIALWNGPWPVYLKGTLYRISDAQNLLCMKIEEKGFVSVKLPELTERRSRAKTRLLRGIDGYLHYIRDHERSRILVWMLDDYSTGKWILKRNVDSEAMIVQKHIPHCSQFYWYFFPMACHPDSEVLFLVGATRKDQLDEEVKEIFSYNLRNNRLEKACNFRDDLPTLYTSVFLRQFFPFSPTAVEFFHGGNMNPIPKPSS